MAQVRTPRGGLGGPSGSIPDVRDAMSKPPPGNRRNSCFSLPLTRRTMIEAAEPSCSARGSWARPLQPADGWFALASAFHDEPCHNCCFPNRGRRGYMTRPGSQEPRSLAAAFGRRAAPRATRCRRHISIGSWPLGNRNHPRPSGSMLGETCGGCLFRMQQTFGGDGSPQDNPTVARMPHDLARRSTVPVSVLTKICRRPKVSLYIFVYCGASAESSGAGG